MVTLKVTGGKKLEGYLKQFAQKTSTARAVDVGFMDGATYPSGVSVATMAAFQEYGTGKIPPRSFMRPTVAKRSSAWVHNLGVALALTKGDAAKALAMVGLNMQENFQTAITELMAPALSPVTVMLRGMRRNNPSLEVTGATVGEAAMRVAAGMTDYGASQKPLVDTGHMLDSLTFKVR